MRQLILNEFEKIIVQDINDMQKVAHQSIFEDFLYKFFGSTSGVLDQSFKASYTSALVGSLTAGLALLYDSSQTGYDPKFRMIKSANAIALNFATAHASLNRIDLVCLAPNYAVSGTASRYVKTGGVGPITLTTVDKDKIDGYTLNIVQGTPNASPAVPATPSGHIALAQVLITAAVGMSSAAAITDVRNILDASPKIPQIYKAIVGTSSGCTHATLALALADSNVAAGSRILVTENQTVTSSITCSKNNMVIDFSPGATLSGSLNPCLTLSGNGVRVKGGRFSGHTKAINITGDYCFVTENRFASCTDEVTDNSSTGNAVVAMNVTE